MNLTFDSIIAAVVGAVIGGAGFVGLVFYFIRRYIDGKINAKEKENAQRRDMQFRRLKIEDEMEHAIGRLFYFIHKAITTGQHNGDFERAWEQFQAAEEKKKALDREILVENELNK